MKLIIEIPDSYNLDGIRNGSIYGQLVLNAVKNGIPIPNNATFGDVIEKITNRKLLEDNKNAYNIIISTKLWNAPYRKGGKE